MDWLQFIWKWLSTAFSVPIRATEIIFLLLTIVGLFVIQKKPDLEPAMKTALWAIPLSVLTIVLVVSLVKTAYDMHTEQEQTITSLRTELESVKRQTYPTLEQIMLLPYFQNTDIPLGSLSSALANSTMINKTFENCRIVGPAVVYLGNNNTIVNSSFDGNPDSIFIVTTNKQVWGIIVLDQVTFLKCTFTKVSFIGPQDQIDKIKAGFSPPVK